MPFKSLVLAGLFLIASGCSLLETKDDTTPIDVSFADPNRIEFQGKGAGAGIALMGTMGAMGIAIGVAIDEGIAKDIRDASLSAGFDVEQSISKALLSTTEGDYYAVYGAGGNVARGQFESDQVENMPLKLRIERYGFKTTGGSDDQTTAEIELEYSQPNGDSLQLHYPNDFEDQSGFELKTYPLERLKKEGTLSVELLNIGFEHLLKRLFGKKLGQ